MVCHGCGSVLCDWPAVVCGGCGSADLRPIVCHDPGEVFARDVDNVPAAYEEPLDYQDEVGRFFMDDHELELVLARLGS